MPIMLLSASLATASEFYTWTDEQGVTHFTDKHPKHLKKEALEPQQLPRGEVNIIQPPAVVKREASPTIPLSERIHIIGANSNNTNSGHAKHRLESPCQANQNHPMMQQISGLLALMPEGVTKQMVSQQLQSNCEPSSP